MLTILDRLLLAFPFVLNGVTDAGVGLLHLLVQVVSRGFQLLRQCLLVNQELHAALGLIIILLVVVGFRLGLVLLQELNVFLKGEVFQVEVIILNKGTDLLEVLIGGGLALVDVYLDLVVEGHHGRVEHLLEAHLDVHEATLELGKLCLELLAVLVLVTALIALGLHVVSHSLAILLVVADELDGSLLGQGSRLLELTHTVVNNALALLVAVLHELLVLLGWLILCLDQV